MSVYFFCYCLLLSSILFTTYVYLNISFQFKCNRNKVCIRRNNKLNYNTPPLSCRRQITLSNIDEIFPLAIPNQISFISMFVPSLVKIPLLKLLPRNENMGVSRADNSFKIWRNLPISNPNPDLYNINALSKLSENPLMFTQVIIWKRTDRWTDRHMDIQLETIVRRHYCVAG